MSRTANRSYSSALRRQQAEATNRAIVETAVELLTDDPAADLSHERVAEGAGMAVRTVYRHFPSRSELLDAVWEEIDARLGLSEFPETTIELLAFVPELYRRLEQHAPVVKALITSPTGQEMARRTDERRLAAIECALSGATAHLPTRERNQLVALVRVLTSPLTWYLLQRKTRVVGDEPAAAVDWALRTLISAAAAS